MKHINIEIDDSAIIERVERQAEATILHELAFTAKSAIFKPFGNYKVPTNVPTEYFDGKIDKFLEDNKQEIINAAAERLACKLYEDKVNGKGE